MRITNLRDYAGEHTLYVFVADVKHLREIDAELSDAVFDACNAHHIDHSTPLLLHRVNDTTHTTAPNGVIGRRE